ncbi:5062_t:CDS:2, partial [Gigaspora rosea]
PSKMSKNTHQLLVLLENTGSLIQELHYGPYSQFWWNFSVEKNICTVNFPIHLGQQVKISLNKHDFFLTIKQGVGNLPEYYCKSDQVEAIESSPTKAVLAVYVAIFKNSTRYLGHMILGWNNPTIIEALNKDIAQAIKRYVKLGFEVENGDDIESVIKDIASIHVANLNSDRNI